MTGGFDGRDAASEKPPRDSVAPSTAERGEFAAAFDDGRTVEAVHEAASGSRGPPAHFTTPARR